MIPLRLTQLADVVGGEVARPEDAQRIIDAVTIDSRAVTGPGVLFVPLRGAHADGHAYIADAARRGAAGYLYAAARLTSAGLPDAPGAVVVDDPADALVGLGAWVRDEVDPLVVAVTGSNGKTTTKDLIAAAISTARRTVATPGSYNNELGVPLTCCLLERSTEVLVTELGCRGLGHIAALASWVRPDIAVVTTVAGAHLELLGDLDTVARAKGELVESLTAEGVAVLNGDDARVAAMAARAPGRVVRYGSGVDADWRAVDVRMDPLARPVFRAVHPDGEADVRLPVPGVHNVSNALAALAAAAAAGVDPAAAAGGIAQARLSRWRMELRTAPSGLVVLNDAYNANPQSMAAALRTLGTIERGGRRWAVLGLMAELGPGSAEQHTDIGALAAKLGIDRLVVVGEAGEIAEGALAAGMPPTAVERVADPEAAVAAVLRAAQPHDVVLVKASRSVGLERVAEALAP